MVRPILLAFVAIITSSVMYQVGLFDWPSFTEDTISADLCFLMASISSDDIAGNAERLATGTKDAIKRVAGDKMAAPAAAYGAPEGAEALSAGLYFDDPRDPGEARWGVGWAVDIKSKDELQNILNKVSAVSELEEPIRAVKIGGGGKVLKGRIPWRMRLTPAIAPMLHWGRAYKAYENGDYKSDCGRDGEEGSVALEIYVTGPEDSMEYIDYIVLMGDTSAIFDDMLPLDDNEVTPPKRVSPTTSSESKPVSEVHISAKAELHMVKEEVDGTDPAEDMESIHIMDMEPSTVMEDHVATE